MGACCTKEKVEDIVEDVESAVNILKETVDAFEDVMDVIDEYIKGQSDEEGKDGIEQEVFNQLSHNTSPKASHTQTV